MRRISVADAKNQLPALLHAAEKAPVEIVRRGKPVAVLISRAAYDRLEGRGDFARAARAFREKHRATLDELGDGLAEELGGARDRGPGRNVRL
jgi:prevent-host-death family protein